MFNRRDGRQGNEDGGCRGVVGGLGVFVGRVGRVGRRRETGEHTDVWGCVHGALAADAYRGP
ncbi:hypothetical protein GCM10009838_21610 [Catenulispora subtropica]|uniref:Uncharacterized protein n=1 Tax=Catenulispora subtropica TaxID=450798 RepID=A0ABP5CHB8_9ACTN